MTAVHHRVHRRDWIRAWNAHDADAYAALFDPAASMLILGTYYPSVDSLKAGAGQVMAARSNEHWTLDRIAVRVFNDHQALVQALFSGRYTTASGATWEFKSSGYLTMLVERRDGTWKIVAAQNHGSGTRVNP